MSLNSPFATWAANTVDGTVVLCQWSGKNWELDTASVVERLERDFDRAKRILVPNLSDWTQAGRVLARLAAKYNYEKIGQGPLTNDALIAACRVSHLPVASDRTLTHGRR